jgi:ABC-2 type transport system permease protein
MNAIAIAELRMLLRNKLVAACAILIPLGLGVAFLTNIDRGDVQGAAIISMLQLLVMVAMGVYVTATTTLAARRQNLFLKRLRSGAVSDAAIIAGLVLPIVFVSLGQVAIIIVALSVAAGTAPANLWLLVIVVLAIEIMFAGFALATAGVTNSPEHAQVTTLPLFLLPIGGAFFVLVSGTEEFGLAKQLLPGGALPELMGLAWVGGDTSSALWLLLPTLGWAAIALVAARMMFRWEPRH